MVVVSNSSKINHLLKRGEEIRTVYKVGVLNSLTLIYVYSHLQATSFSFIEIGCAGEDSPNAVPIKDNNPPDVVSTNLPNGLSQDNKILGIVEQIEYEF